jgi:predicted metal-binding membrane protein
MSSDIPAFPAPRVPGSGAIIAIAVALFAGTTIWTIQCAHDMSGGMHMTGGWTMSMVWMPMAGQSMLGACVMFVAMWTVMMIVMMLPSAMPMIMVYHRVTTFHKFPRVGLNVWLMVAGYFAVWAALGVLVCGAGMLLAQAEMRSDALSRAVPPIAGIALILAGIYQWTPWKDSCLKHCRDPFSLVACHIQGGSSAAIRLGLHHGLFCALCCWSLMLIQIVLGMMNLIVMALIALVIALEKLLPRGIAVARVAGVVSVLAGIALIAGTFRI